MHSKSQSLILISVTSQDLGSFTKHPKKNQKIEIIKQQLIIYINKKIFTFKKFSKNSLEKKSF